MEKSNATLSPSEAWITGAPGAMACIWSPTAGSGSHSMDDKLGRVFRLRAAVGGNQRDGLALPDRAVGGEQQLRRRTVARPMQRDADEGLASRVDVGRGEDRGDARRVLRGLDIDRDDLGVRMRAAHEAGVQHARQLDVVDVAAMAAEQPLQLAPRDARADAGG